MTAKKLVKKLTKTMTVGGKVYRLLESYCGHSKPAWTRRDMENIAGDIDILRGYDTLVVKELGGDYGIYGRKRRSGR